ncbi:MAG: hypothetical protein HZB80_03550 [Deltaproteobacteria bacterium]|nr:hypothetical protein [Deltaproteobacteria bacterium]
MRKILMIVLGIWLLFNPMKAVCSAEQIAVIVNKANQVSKMSSDEVKKLYTNDVLTWSDGKNVNLYDLSTGDPARKDFSNKVLGKDAEKVAEEWANKKITNSAKNPPITVKSSILVLDRVGKDVSAIGYLLKKDVKGENVKIIATID